MNYQILQPNTTAELYGNKVTLYPAANDFVSVVPTSESSKEEPKLIPAVQLNLAFNRGHLKFVFDAPDELPEAANQSMKQRAAQDLMFIYIQRLRQQNYTSSNRVMKAVIAEVARELEDPKPPSPTTLYRANKRFEEQGNLLKKISKRPQRFHDAAIDLFYELVDDMFLRRGGPKPAAVWEEYEKQAQERFGGQIKGFSRSTFYKRIGELCRVDVSAAREGKKAARDDARIVQKHLITSRILERLEMDAIHINIALLTDEGEIVTQVIVYMIIDCYSRCILGYHLEVSKTLGQKIKKGENKRAVMQSVINSMQPKPHMSFVNGQYYWTPYGTGSLYVTDAGRPYTGHEVGGFLTAAGGDLHIAESGAGYRKPYIERFFGTLRTQFLSLILGYLGKRKEDKTYDYKPADQACLTVKEFEGLLANYIVTQYHQRPHKGLLGQTPQAAWNECLNTSTTQLKVPDIGRLVRANIAPIYRTLQAHKGIEIHGAFYNSPALKRLYNQISQQGGKNPKVKCIFTDLEPEQAWVENPLTGEQIKAEVKGGTPGLKSGISLDSDEVVLGAEVAFSFNHPLLQLARKRSEVGFRAADARRVRPALNTRAITEQFNVFNAQTQQDLVPMAQASAPEEIDQGYTSRDQDMDQWF